MSPWSGKSPEARRVWTVGRQGRAWAPHGGLWGRGQGAGHRYLRLGPGDFPCCSSCPGPGPPLGGDKAWSSWPVSAHSWHRWPLHSPAAPACGSLLGSAPVQERFLVTGQCLRGPRGLLSAGYAQESKPRRVLPDSWTPSSMGTRECAAPAPGLCCNAPSPCMGVGLCRGWASPSPPLPAPQCSWHRLLEAFLPP